MDGPWRFIHDQMRAGRTAALLVVVDHIGSTPGKRGFKLAVAEDGRLEGTIGGGVMEHRLVEEVKADMARGLRYTRLLDQVHHKKAPVKHQSGMICAGAQTIAIHILVPQDSEAILQIKNQNGVSGGLALSPDGLTYEDADSQTFGLIRESDSSWTYRERIRGSDIVYIIGGGHVGLAVSRTLELLDMAVHVFDHRKDVATMRAVTCPKTVAPYHELGARVPEGDHVYAVITTTGFDSDAESLKQLIGKNLKYLGLMGSAAKIKHIFDHLRRDGLDPNLFKKVRAPIGIPINNQTPAEIAISIVAEIIQVRNAH